MLSDERIKEIQESVQDRLTQKWPDGENVYKDTEAWPCADCYGKSEKECNDCMVAQLIERLYKFETDDIPDLLAEIGRLKGEFKEEKSRRYQAESNYDRSCGF